MPESYSHRQTSALMLIGGAATALIVIAASWSAPEFPSWLAVGLITLCILAFGQFANLTAVVTDEAVIARFGSGIIRVKFSLSGIRSVRVVQNSWICGWGIRMIPGGWMFNVAGFDAVELELITGRLFRIGTDEPRQLEAAILQAMSVAARRG